MNLFNAFAKHSLPQVAGTLAVSGLRSAVEIIRDRWGVPHIYAASIEDVLFAQGFAHAQDRLWQMDVNRRAGQGRLSETFGSMTLDLDRFTRTIGLARAAQAELDATDPDSLRLLDAYIAGVNAWIGRGPLPVEHRLLRMKVEPWTRLDSAAWGLLLAWALSWNWESELERLALWRQLGPEQAATLESEYPATHATILSETSGLEDVSAHLLKAYRELNGWLMQSGEGAGSNNWVVAPSRTSTGRPMLANDPHLRLSLPSIWYENHLIVTRPERNTVESKDAALHVTGITLPGVPGVILGHNERIAWGATATIADTQDLYIERFDPNDPSRYQTPSGWEPAQVIRESIRVRFRRKPVEHVVRITRHGPLITDVLPREASHTSLALKWVAHQPGNWLRSIFALNRATDWASFKDALRDWHTPAINMVYADALGERGHIAYRVAGRIPIRRSGHGLLPAAGWMDDYEWIGDIPFDELPEQTSQLTPQSGAQAPNGHTIVTANNRVVGPAYPYFISHEWLNGHRAERIRQRLDACECVSIEDSLSIQMDVRSLDAAEIVEPLLKLEPRNGREAAALNILRKWDGTLSSNSIAASIYEVVQIELVHLLFAERLGPAFAGYTGAGQTTLFNNVAFSNIALRQMREMLRQSVTLSAAKGLQPGSEMLRRSAPQHDTLQRAALNAALDTLTQRFGSDMRAWQWGRLHQIEPAHTLAQVRPLRRFFNRGSFPLGGDGDTPQQANFKPVWPIESISVAPSHRVVYDVGAWDNSVAVIAGGQSGHPASPHYFDQFALWLKGETRPMRWSREAVEREMESKLSLMVG